MANILADVNVEGHLRTLMQIFESPTWLDLWKALEVNIVTFEQLELPRTISDRVLWEVCQRLEVILFTANRNADSPESLEAAIRRGNTIRSLPVITIGDPERFFTDRPYAESVAERLLEILLDCDELRGAGRVFVP